MQNQAVSIQMDHDSPLNKRGKRDAPHIGELLQNEHLVPDLIIRSTAKRTYSTAKAVAKAAGYEGDIALNQSLYAAPPTAGLVRQYKSINIIMYFW